MESAVQERVDQQLRQGQKQEDFHSELIGLRQRWRLKKTGTSIMGDLTYRSGTTILTIKVYWYE
jgi:mediator of RNA polymerase II transcription subunit 17